MKVVHCKKEKYDVYIGRGCHGFPLSKWGNPFIIGVDGDRDDVIDKYKKYVLSRPDLMASLPELENKTLGCWCRPKRCHGDILIELIMDSYKRTESYNLF